MPFDIHLHRPRIKPELRVRRIGVDTIRVGGLIYGIGSEIPDPTGDVWELMELLDGTRTVGRIVSDMAHRAAHVSETDVRSCIDALAAAGFLEDDHDDRVHELSDEERDRYGRGRSYFSWVDGRARSTRWHAQLVLRGASVVIIGVGGTGGIAAMQLAASGVGRLHLVEPDTVELSNLNRQLLFRESDIGRPKVEAAVEHLVELNSSIAITAARDLVVDAEQIRDLVVGFDLLVLAADRPPEIRQWSNEACMDTSTPWVHGGYQGPQVTTGLYDPRRPGTCYDCIQLGEADKRKIWPARSDLASRVEPSVANAANASSTTLSGTMLAHTALSLLTGAPDVTVNRMYSHSLMQLDHAFEMGGDVAHPDCIRRHTELGEPVS